MKNPLRVVVLGLHGLLYAQLKKYVLFKLPATQAHRWAIAWLRVTDGVPPLVGLARLLRQITLSSQPVEVGGVALNHPLILAAGFVKGDGFSTEAEALQAVTEGRNIIPGWRTMPALVGPVEFGSFTRAPRHGNPGETMWRRVASQSTQNRVGLKNPGAAAAAEFLSQRRKQLPRVYGINIAITPGLPDVELEARDMLAALDEFLSRNVLPAWFTLNISCPNTEDDPNAHQTGSKTRILCERFLARLRERGVDVPLWVKISPGLSVVQVWTLARVLSRVGVQAIVATNTTPRSAPDESGHQAGVGGGELYQEALQTVMYLRMDIIGGGLTLDIIGCGGLLDGDAYHAYRTLGVKAIQYWSALVYRGPLAAAHIQNEFKDEIDSYHASLQTIDSESLVANQRRRLSGGSADPL